MATANSNRPATEEDVSGQIEALYAMRVGELQDRYAEVFGERTRTHHKLHLIRKIAWRLQALAWGDLSDRARQRAAELARDADVRIRPPKDPVVPDRIDVVDQVSPSAVRDSRLPAIGTVLVRQYKGSEIQVLVRDDGFEYDGQRFRTLSATAKAITGSHVNGFRFFGLTEGATP